MLEKIAEMPQPDRSIAERIPAIVEEAAPQLAPRLWYGMPAYAQDGAIVCFFQNADKFKARYPPLGFSDRAHLDDGPAWPTSYAVTQVSPEVEERISGLIRRAVG
ncbi:iron chaperone [Arthrobacter sp. JSM 101049]|uniref:iron chaperone n=1 Tax=Arthrobacter sp. JSM 101049 TaxID=929097 RepID=UPI0035658755